VTRSGFIGLAGRPNVGKSTLVNAIVGAKVAIISDRPQTTRRAARGVATHEQEEWQMVLIDLPGVQRPRDVLTERMQRRVEQELSGADAVLFLVNAEQGIGPGDLFIARHMLQADPATPVICAVNKIDRLGAPEITEVLAAAGELEVVDEVFPISARRGTGVQALVSRLVQALPEGPYMYPPESRTDQPSEVHLAELIREQVLRRTREELPHAVEVSVLEANEREDGLIEVRAQLWAEEETQKAILIGKGGRMIRDIGTAARKELERELGAKVFLDLQVRVREHWRRDEGLLDRLGID
jgi:GTP-binding protein Era